VTSSWPFILQLSHFQIRSSISTKEKQKGRTYVRIPTHTHTHTHTHIRTCILT